MNPFSFQPECKIPKIKNPMIEHKLHWTWEKNAMQLDIWEDFPEDLLFFIKRYKLLLENQLLGTFDKRSSFNDIPYNI